MLTQERVQVAIEVLEAIREMSLDRASDAMANGRHDIAAEHLVNGVRMKHAIAALRDEQEDEIVIVPNWLKRQAE